MTELQTIDAEHGYNACSNIFPLRPFSRVLFLQRAFFNFVGSIPTMVTYETKVWISEAVNVSSLRC